jgi:hypothetical protein
MLLKKIKRSWFNAYEPGSWEFEKKSEAKANRGQLLL